MAYRCNEAATAVNVKRFFENDFWHYINQGGVHPSQLSSPQLSFTPGGHTNINGVEKSLIRDMSEAEKARYKAMVILIALSYCTDFQQSRHQSILRGMYLDQMTSAQIENNLNLSDYTFRKQSRKAAVEFAERLNFEEKVRGINDLPDLLCK